MRAWRRTLVGALLVGAVATAGIALNFTLLRLTQDAHDPVGKLSPRAVFLDQAQTVTVPVVTTTGTDDGSSHGTAPVPEPGDGDSDD